jgi:hypothetical protein
MDFGTERVDESIEVSYHACACREGLHRQSANVPVR